MEIDPHDDCDSYDEDDIEEHTSSSLRPPLSPPSHFIKNTKMEKERTTDENEVVNSLRQLGMELVFNLPSFAATHQQQHQPTSSTGNEAGPTSAVIAQPLLQPSASSFLLSLTPLASYSMSSTSSTYAPILTYDIIRFGTQLPFAEG
jgi:hypothetical protein